jgi:serine/threonine-protein kinase
MTQPQPPVSGLVAGKYEVVGLIGRGGMGSVWEGRHASLGTRVAIKFIDPEYAESKEAQSRFVNEARAAATIHTKHAIQIFDHGVTEDGRPYIVMELLIGEPLDKRIERLGRITLAETARVLVQVCRALQRAHDAGIIHRDLKPENIFLVRSPDDEDEIAKVLDFGIAKMKGPPGGEGLTSSTKTGAVLGTPYYMSPEQARGLRSIDYRSDLWSLGVIAYKCVTGVLPFEGESVGDLLVKICTAPPPLPSMTIPGLPAAFDAWFVRALEREPPRRYASATELADALAFAAGISLRRGPNSSQNDGVRGTLPQTPLPEGVAYGGQPVPVAPYAATPLPTAGMTSAPFVTSTSVPKSSRGALFGILAVALVGAGVGSLAVVKWLGPARHAPASLASQGAATSAATTTPVAALPSATATAPSASVAPLPPLAEAAPTPKPPGANPSPARTPRPPSGAAKPTPPSPLPAPSASPAPAPAKPPPKPQQPASGDPGY